MRIFITGASGFLGYRVIRRLIDEHHTLFALTRKEEQAKQLQELGATPIKGALENMDDWADILSNTDTVIHLAALVKTWGPWDTFYQIIVRSTRQLLELSEQRGVKRFIYISSESVLQDGRPLLDIDENYPYPENPSSFYGRAKMLAEQEIRKHCGKMEIIILRPTFIWGEDSFQLHDLILRAKKKQFLWIDKGNAMFEHVHVDNVVEAIIQSLTRGKNKEVYLITNDEPMPAKQFFNELFHITKTPAPRFSLPSKLVYPISRWLERIWSQFRLNGRPPLIRFEIEFLSLPRKYNIEKAKDELQYKPLVTFEEGIRKLALRARS